VVVVEAVKTEAAVEVLVDLELVQDWLFLLLVVLTQTAFTQSQLVLAVLDRQTQQTRECREGIHIFPARPYQTIRHLAIHTLTH
jgi:hypothetical protein